MKSKPCSKCLVRKPLSAFWSSSVNADGLRGVCKACVQEQNNRSRREAKKRHCAKCGLTKFASAFSNSKNIHVWCKECCKVNAAKWRAGNPERVIEQEKARSNNPARKQYQRTNYGRAYRLFARYGINDADYDTLFTKQKGLCAICAQPPSKANTRWGYLHVDHCHTTRNVRGLLCMHCNKGLGSFKDSIPLLTAASRYMAQHTFSLQDQG